MSPDPKVDALPEVHVLNCHCTLHYSSVSGRFHSGVDMHCINLQSKIRRSILEAELRGLEIHDLPYLAARRTKLKEELAALKEPR